ncbi:hypothetical protein BGW37DRAFT_226279 [Umbelopsis sp. PMI_123]|nr:hypothetical protein BGW37DRAFT_226279 [Umbelopsis sp. PMI_123]
MKDIVSVDVLSEKSSIDVYGPLTPDAPPLQLRGTVRLQLAKAAKFKVLTLKFKGYHQILEKFPETSVVDSLSTVLADICETQVNLVSPSSTLSAGQHNIPFLLSIPGNLPQSFENASGHLRYEFTVTAREASGWLNLESHKYKRQIQVHRHYIPSLEEAPFLDPRVTFSKRVSRFFDMSLEYPSVVPVEQHGFSVYGNIAPLSRRGTPLKVVVTLKQVKETRNSSKDPSRPNRTECRVPSKLTSEETLFGPLEYDFQTGQPGELKPELSKAGQRIDVHYDFDFSFKLDQTKIQKHLDTPLLDITHCIYIQVYFVDSPIPFEAQVPIIMTTIPSRPPGFEESTMLVNPHCALQEEPEKLPTYQRITTERR